MVQLHMYRQINKENKENKEVKKLAKELHKPITRKFKKQEVSLSFIDNIWGYQYCACAIKK